MPEEIQVPVLTLASVKTSKATPSTSSSIEVVIEALSAPIQGKFGAFSVVRIAGNDYNVDSRKVSNFAFYPKSKAATIQLVDGKKRDGSNGVFIQSVAVHMPNGAIALNS